MYAMRELMLMEVPDRWSDVLLADVGADASPPATVEMAPLYLAARTDLSNVYLRAYKALIGRTNTVSGAVEHSGRHQKQPGRRMFVYVSHAGLRRRRGAFAIQRGRHRRFGWRRRARVPRRLGTSD